MKKILFLITFLGVVFAPLANASIGILPILDKPSDVSRFELVAYPGETLTAKVKIINNSEDASTYVRFFAADERKQDNPDAFVLEENEVVPKFVGAWIVPKQNLIELEPKQSKEVEFSIVVPKDNPIGLYRGGFIAAEVPDKMETSADSAVRIVSQIAARVYVDVQERPIGDIITDEVEKSPYITSVAIVIGVLLVIVFIWGFTHRKKARRL